MKVEIEISEDEAMELKGNMSLKKVMVVGGFMEAAAEDRICMRVLRAVHEQAKIEAVADNIMEGKP